MKNCTRCNSEKKKSCFGKKKLKNSYGLRSHCNACRKIDKLKWKQKTKNSIESIIGKIKNDNIHGFGQSPSIVQVVTDLTLWMNNPTWKQRIYHIKNDIKNIDTCKCCNNNVRFMDYKKKYSEYCSVECQKKDSQERRKIQSTQSSKRYNKRHPHIYAWRNVLRNFIVNSRINKTDQTHNMLGYSAIELKEHITKQFQPGMSWENYGNWHIDHIRPLTKFNIVESSLVVNALSNLQPLWAGDNISKGNKYK